MRKELKKQNIMIAIIALLLVVTIGYATLQANLTINGTSKINNSTWNVHFNNPSEATTGSVAIDTTKYANAKAATKDDATTVSYNVLLTNPGDFYEFTVPVQNEGSIDAMIDTITSTIKIGTGNVTTINSSSDLPAWLNYSVTYSDGITIAPKHQLNAGDTETYKVRVEFKRDITNAQLDDAAGKELQLTFSVDYVQKDNTAVAKPIPTFTGTKYGVYPNANKLTLNSAVPANAILHLDASDALADWTKTDVMNKASTMPFYFKHKIENDVVKESYVVFTVTEEMATANPGMVAGTYELRGEKTWENGEYIVGEDYISPYYEVNKEAIKTAFGYSTNPSRCSESGTGRSSIFVCSVSGFNAHAYAYGYVDARDGGSSICHVINDGSSYCR